MPVPIDCPKCKFHCHFPDAFACKVVSCPKCRATFHAQWFKPDAIVGAKPEGQGASTARRTEPALYLRCPGCRKGFRAGEELVGKHVKCPWCDLTVIVPRIPEA